MASDPGANADPLEQVQALWRTYRASPRAQEDWATLASSVLRIVREDDGATLPPEAKDAVWQEGIRRGYVDSPEQMQALAAQFGATASTQP